MKKILILIGSLISALVLFVCISFNTSVYAYDTSSETSYSKSLTYVTNTIFTYSSGSYTDNDNITHSKLDFTFVNQSQTGSSSNFFITFNINNSLVSEDYVLLINSRFTLDSFNNATTSLTHIYRGSSGTATSLQYQLSNGSNSTQLYENVNNNYYNSSTCWVIKKTFINDFINNNTTSLRLRYNYSYVAGVPIDYSIYNIDFIPISQLSSSLYFVNYASGLQSMYDNLLSDYNDLNDSYEDLESDYSTLESSYSSLESQYNTLLLNYNTLQANYNDLVDNYSEMFQQYEDLQAEFESLSNAVDDIKRYSYLYYLFNDVPVYTLANIDWHDVNYNYYRSDVSSAKQLIDTLNKDYTYTEDSAFWYYDTVTLNDDSQKIVFYNNIPNDFNILKSDSNFVSFLSQDLAYYFDISKVAYNGFIEMLFDTFNWSEILYNYTIQVLYDNNEVVTYDLSSYLSDNNLSLNSEGYSSLGFKLEPSAIGLYIKCSDNGDFYPNSLYIATDTWYYNSGYSAGVQSQAETISNLSNRITELNNTILTLRKNIETKDEQIAHNFGWTSFFGGLVDIPFMTIFNFFNVDILGFNLFGVLAGIITALAMLWLIKRLYK